MIIILGAIGALIALGYSQNATHIPTVDPQIAPISTAYSNVSTATKWHSMPRCNGIIIEDATIEDLQSHLTSRNLSSVQLVTCYMQRIFQTNPYINSVLEINPDALDIARILDLERHEGHVRSKLHGIPYLVKDNIGTKDAMQTTAGSWALLGSMVPRDAFVVSKLREAGAVLLGKATLSEWADIRSSNYSEGYSARGGQARSPYNFSVNPGGSSTGSAIAVSNNVVPFSLGTETDGSVINPAMRNAIVGIKPTVGLTSRAGVIPESEHQDTIGVFGKTVADAVHVLDAIYGIDERDNYTLAQTGKAPSDGFARFLNTADALKGAKFGLPWDSFWKYADAAQLEILNSMIEVIKEAGATVINGTELPHRDTIVSPTGWDWYYGRNRGYPNESESTYVIIDFYNNIATYLADLSNTEMRSLEDIVQYNKENLGSEGGAPNIHPAFGSGQDVLLEAVVTKGIRNETYWQALSFCQRTSREEGIDAALSNGVDPLDALFIPPDVAQSVQIAAQAGYPIITIPASVHSDSGMPFGLAVLGTAFSEATLVKHASAIENLMVRRDTPFQRSRTPPRWEGYLDRVLPVPF